MLPLETLLALGWPTFEAQSGGSPQFSRYRKEVKGGRREGGPHTLGAYLTSGPCVHLGGGHEG